MTWVNEIQLNLNWFVGEASWLCQQNFITEIYDAFAPENYVQLPAARHGFLFDSFDEIYGKFAENVSAWKFMRATEIGENI